MKGGRKGRFRRSEDGAGVTQHTSRDVCCCVKAIAFFNAFRHNYPDGGRTASKTRFLCICDTTPLLHSRGNLLHHDEYGVEDSVVYGGCAVSDCHGTYSTQCFGQAFHRFLVCGHAGSLAPVAPNARTEHIGMHAVVENEHITRIEPISPQRGCRHPRCTIKPCGNGEYRFPLATTVL